MDDYLGKSLFFNYTYINFFSFFSFINWFLSCYMYKIFFFFFVVFSNQERKNKKLSFSLTINLLILISKYDLSPMLSNLTEKKRVLFVCLLLNYSNFFLAIDVLICPAVLIDSTRLMISVCYYVWYMFLFFSASVLAFITWHELAQHFIVCSH
jgi:hypothetical protein